MVTVDANNIDKRFKNLHSYLDTKRSPPDLICLRFC